MKRFFCFYCQKEVEPHRLLRWRFCPQCKRLITDNGDGFYRVCDNCGANMPVDVAHCPKCGRSTGMPETVPTTLFKQPNVWFSWLIRIALIILSLVLSVGILYVSFYLIFAFFVIGLAFWLFNLFLPRR